MPLHVYAVVPGDQSPPDRTGVRDEPLDLVRSGALAAVVSGVDPDSEATEDDATVHLDVITALVATGPVVPMRFGTIAPDADAVRREVLDESRAALQEHLRATRDVVEAMVTIQFDEDAALAEILRRQPRRDSWQAESLADKIALGESIAAGLVAHVHEWGDELMQPAVGVARAVTALDTPEHTTVRYALLVRRDRLADLDSEMAQLPPAVGGTTVPFAVEYVGPLPPVDFPLQPTSDGGGSSEWSW